MGSTDYTLRVAGPELLERARDNVITAPIYRDGAPVAPSSGTCVVLRPDGSQVAAPSVSVVSSVARATVTAASLAGLAYEEGWTVEWVLVMPDGFTHTFRRSAALVRRRIYPVITDGDLLRRHSDLATQRPASMASFQDFLDEAWVELVHRLRAQGSLAHLVMEPEALRFAHLFKTLELIFRDWSITASGDEKWAHLATDYGQRFAEDWGRLQFRYDEDKTGAVDETTKRGAQPPVFLTSNGWASWQGYTR